MAGSPSDPLQSPWGPGLYPGSPWTPGHSAWLDQLLAGGSPMLPFPGDSALDTAQVILPSLS